MPILQKITYTLPEKDEKFTADFLGYLGPLGSVSSQEIVFRQSSVGYVPETCIAFSDVISPVVLFSFDTEATITIPIVNTTGITKTSPHAYSPISLQNFLKRVAASPIRLLDHTGFNLPYFDGTHPHILKLREQLKSTCLYHTFPKHLQDAPWDFILPGTTEEVSGTIATDYSLTRTPKVEIVSFEKSSKPLIQIDLQLEGSYEVWCGLFPEGIRDEKARNVWVYIRNNFGIDMCFVLNEIQPKDWSYHFSESRVR